MNKYVHFITLTHFACYTDVISDNISPSSIPSWIPTIKPSSFPIAPTIQPSVMPSVRPTVIPTSNPTLLPTNIVVGHWTMVAYTGLRPWRQQHSSVINAATGLIYTIGGWAGGSGMALSDVWIFNINTGK